MASKTNGHSPRSPRPDPLRLSQRRPHNSPSHPPRSSPRYPPKRTTPWINPDSAPNTPATCRPRQSNRSASGPVICQRRGSMSSVSGDRPPTPVSKSSLKSSHHSSQHGAQSTLLLQKLQQERRTEIQRNLTRLTGDLSSSDESKTIAVTPGGEHHENARLADSDMKKGFSLKETEQTMTTLHKQNFDLKLELFHRRERQTLLEQRLELLETAKAQADLSNDKLLQELEKRDKALEEAVHMIVSLEERVELLLREREMTRQGEANKAFQFEVNADPTTPFNQTTPKPHNDASLANARHHLAKMPSFVSEQSEHTENLRSVYLGNKDSFMSLSKLDSRAGNNGFASPSMSVLSETSFPSVYGHKTTKDESFTTTVPISTLGKHGNSGQRSVSMPVGDMTPSRPQKSEQGTRRDGRRDASDGRLIASPLRTVTEADAANEDWRPKTAKPPKTKPLARPKDDRDRERQLGRNTVDDAVSNSHRLPPTPDTMASSTRNLGQSIEESSRPGQTLCGRVKYPVSSPLKLDQTEELEPGDWRFKSVDAAQAPSVTAFTGRKEYYGAASYESRLPVLRRPRSADETTISRHKNDWDSCSDADDLCSEASSFDYWMKEGLRPSHGSAFNARNRPSSSRNPPDFFGFPSDEDKWQSGDMFGALRGTGYYGHGASSNLNGFGGILSTSGAGLYGSSLIGMQPSKMDAADNVPPPAPHRRSSLHARTSAPGTPTDARAPGFPDKNMGDVDKLPTSNHASRSCAQNGFSKSTPANNPAASSALQGMEGQQQDNVTDKRRYPPHAQSSKPSAGRPLSRGITNLFRRSLISSNSAQASAPASVPANQSPFPPPVELDASTPAIGVPAWERRNDLADDMYSATPPPIMRRRGSDPTVDGQKFEFGRELYVAAGHRSGRAGRGASGASPLGLGDGLNAAFGAQDGGAPLGTSTKEAATQEKLHGQTSQGHGRRWFGLGRGPAKTGT